MTERERGTMLRTLDPEYLGQQAIGHLRVVEPNAEWVSAKPVYGLAAAESPEDGKLYAVVTEGVGYEVGYGSPLALDVWVEWDHEGQSGLSQTEVYLSAYEVREAMQRGTDVDLADHVRKFGDRLEVNFGIWHRKFNPRPKRVRKAAKK